jgi:invasion protein IalB
MPPQAASEPVKPAAPAAEAVAPAAAQSTTAASGEFVAPAGYQKKHRGDTTVYCKRETPIGTRFAKEYCYTQADLERMEASKVNLKQEVERTRRTCTGGGCGGG